MARVGGDASGPRGPRLGPHLRMWATSDGPYQSPAFLPEVCPSSTRRCRPKGARGWSANQDTICRWHRSCSNSVVPWARRGGVHRACPRYRPGEADPGGSDAPRPRAPAHVQSAGSRMHSLGVCAHWCPPPHPTHKPIFNWNLPMVNESHSSPKLHFHGGPQTLVLAGVLWAWTRVAPRVGGGGCHPILTPGQEMKQQALCQHHLAAA